MKMSSKYLERLARIFHKDKKVITEEEEPKSLVCPNCGSNQWYEGPSDGMATNVKCAGCGLWFNNTPFGLDFIGVKGNIGEHKKIVWYCPQCGKKRKTRIKKPVDNSDKGGLRCY